MTLRSENIPGLRKPDANELTQIAAQWTGGTNPAALKVMRGFLLALSLAVGILMGLAGGDGFRIGRCVTGLVCSLAIFSVFLILWSHQIARIRERSILLRAGAYRVTEATVTNVVTSRGGVCYVGWCQVTLENGQTIRRVAMPYRFAKKYRYTQVPVAAWLVLPEGEKKPLAFIR